MENSNLTASQASQNYNLSLVNVLRIPAVRQVMLLIGVAAAVAAGFAIVLWAQTPGYAPLYSGLESSDVREISETLRTADIDFKLNAKTDGILVPEDSLQTVRMYLAEEGLPKSTTAGMSLMQEQSSFGVSQFMESARYQNALEGELAKTISKLGSVSGARVHLALPKQSSFIRDQKSASASVFLQMHRGRSLEQEQATAVVNLVAGSVPDLRPKNVTVVDQDGSILSTSGELSVGAKATSQFKHARLLEETYKSRIEDLLTPLVGAGRVRAEVVADIDFTVTEEARESFDPSRTAIRSEQINEDVRKGTGPANGGVPGALSNQPPEATETGPTADAENDGINSSMRASTRNYEVDRTISHTRPQAGTIRRLSIAVLIDEGSAERGADDAALTDEDLVRYTTLVREAVGFDESRGDTVVVLGEAFRRVADVVPEDPPAFWEKPLMRDALKQILGTVLVLAIAFGVIRPMLRNVIASQAPVSISGEFLGTQSLTTSTSAAFGGGAAQIPPPSYDEKVAAAKNITGHDPARVAQLVKKWVGADV